MVLKNIFISLVLIALLGQLAGKLIVIINFELNKEYIVENLCVQKEEPDNCCQGSCHLTKELEKQDETEGTANDQQKIKLEQDLNCNDLYVFAGNKLIENVIITELRSFQLAEFCLRVFQPPQTRK